MSKEEKKEPSPRPDKKDQSPSSEGPPAPGPSEVVQEQILKLVDAMNQQMKFVEGLAERTTKIEQSLAGLGEALKAAANPGKPGSFDLGGMLQGLVYRELSGGGGEAEKLLKTFAENYLKQISPDAQRTMFKDLVSILAEGIRLGRTGAISGKEASEALGSKSEQT